MLRDVSPRARPPALLPLLVGLCACGKPAQNGAPGAAAGDKAASAKTACPARASSPGLLPGTRQEQLGLQYWLGRYSPTELDEPLLTTQQVEAYDHGVGRAGSEPSSQRDLLQPWTVEALRAEISERLAYVRERAADGRYVDNSGKAVPKAALEAFDPKLAELRPELRVALATLAFHCAPVAQSLYERKPGAELSLAYDRNACSAAHAQEVVQLLAPWPGGMWLARTRYALGWLESDALEQLSPAIPSALQQTFVRGARMRANRPLVLADATGKRIELQKHTTLPLLADGRVMLATRSGFTPLAADGLEATRRALTRRALFTTAFSFLDSPYGFGDANGGRDCSRLQMDLFEAFDLALPRHSGWQAQAGFYDLDVTGMEPAQKLRALDAVAAHAAVLLAFPGHIMLYLGKDEAGVAMALHALGEFARPCAGGGETVVDVQRTVVSDLKLGEGSSRHSLLERITTLVVIGAQPPPADLAARAALHALPPLSPPAPSACRDSETARIFVSPQWPAAGRALRLIGTTAHAVSAPGLFVYDDKGQLVASESHHLGGPPFSVWARFRPGVSQ